MTNDPGMTEMLVCLTARDTMHKQQWLAVLEETGGLAAQLPQFLPAGAGEPRLNYVYLGFI